MKHKKLGFVTMLGGDTKTVFLILLRLFFVGCHHCHHVFLTKLIIKEIR